MKRSGITEKNSAQGVNNAQGPRLLTVKAAAAYLGLTVWGLRERIWSGDIPVVKFQGGRKQFIDILDIDKFIQEHKTTIS